MGVIQKSEDDDDERAFKLPRRNDSKKTALKHVDSYPSANLVLLIQGSKFALESIVHIWCILCHINSMTLDAPKIHPNFKGKNRNPQLPGRGLDIRDAYLEIQNLSLLEVFPIRAANGVPYLLCF